MEMENPFAKSTFPTLGNPSIARRDRLLTRFEAMMSRLVTRAYDPVHDAEKRSVYIFAQIIEADNGIGAYLEVPEGAGSEEEVVVVLNESTKVVAQLPPDVQAGDNLRVALDENGGLTYLDRIQPNLFSLQPIRVIIVTISCCAIALVIIAGMMPYWVEVKSQDGHVNEFVGPFGLSFRGSMQPWTQFLQQCHRFEEGEIKVSNPSEMFKRCKTYSVIAKFGWACVLMMGACVGTHAWSLSSLLFRRELISLIGAICAVCLEFFIAFHYAGYTKRTIRRDLGYEVNGMGLSTWLVVAAGFLGLMQSVSIFAMWMERSRNRRLRVHGVDVLGVLKHFAIADVRRAKEEDQFEWDETDPGAGCPLVWHTYGLTPAGLFQRYRGFWWGVPYAALLYVLSIPFHFIKTFDWNGVRRVFYGPPSEEEAVRKEGVRSTVVINYMLYRRSNIIMAVVFSLPLLLWTGHAMWEQQGVLMDHVHAQEIGTSYSYQEYEERMHAMGLNGTFYDYTAEMLQHGFGSVTVGSETVDVYKQIVRIVMLLLAFLFACAGMVRWSDFNASRYLLLLGWLCIVISPFFGTLIPSRRFVNWSKFDQAVVRHMNEARTHFELDDLVVQCLDLDSPTLLETAVPHVEKACGIVRRHVPYIMTDKIKVPIPMWPHSINVPYQKIIGEGVLEEGTDLKNLHLTCNKVQQVTDGKALKKVVEFVHSSCSKVTSYLFQHIPPSHRSSLATIQAIAKQPDLPDPTHSYSPIGFVAQLSGDQVVGIPGDVIALAQVSDKSQMENFEGLVLEAGEGSGKICDDFSFLSKLHLKRHPVLLVRWNKHCNLARMRTRALANRVAGILIRDPDGLLEGEKKMFAQQGIPPIALIAHKLDGEFLSAHLQRVAASARGPLGGPSASVVLKRPSWSDKHARTAHGCRCKGLGYESECAVRNPAAFSEDTRDGNLSSSWPYTWCETTDGCPVKYDLCLPPSMKGQVAVMDSRKECLPDRPCQRYHVLGDRPNRKGYYKKHDVCVVREDPDYDDIPNRYEFMTCVPPAGFYGVGTDDRNKSTSLTGSGATMGPGYRSIAMFGRMLTSACKYRVHVLSANIGSPAIQATVRLSRKKQVLLEEEFDNQKQPEIKIQIRFNGPPMTVLQLQQRCDVGLWEPVPEDQLRHVPPPGDTPESFGTADGSSVPSFHTVGTAGETFRVDNRPDTIYEESFSLLQHRDRSRKHSRQNHALLSVDINDNATIPQAPLAICEQFVGTHCGTNKKSCAMNEVCDLSWNEENDHRGFCRCAIGTCWDSTLRTCVPQKVRVADFMKKVMQDDTTIESVVQPGVRIMKAIGTTFISMRQGVGNLNAIMGHILALGPGLLISAWTAKLIFAHSSIPGYFCYFFPWIYAPMAWLTYSLVYQLIPDPRLFVGLAILAFWSLALAVLTLYYGLHKPMSVPRMMYVVNNLLVVYYLMLGIGYGFLLWFVLTYRPQDGFLKDVSLAARFLDEQWNPSKIMMYAISSIKVSALVTWLIDSFAVFFFTCCAVTDFFIMMICREHIAAWRMKTGGAYVLQSPADKVIMSPRPSPRPSPPASPRGSPSPSDNARPPRQTQAAVAASLAEKERLAIEEDVVQNWLWLMRGVPLGACAAPPSRADAAGEEAV
eukprot:TRINITY_DN3627_c0_g2_i1.p1 TRINITY_DN3627_c0_g2~~TRINITY_DN3627_c0_g2_i1.p1  ORF type:complete len:1630 (+),score=252.82 TRINITY_DN3627_c0_g2_i1:205-5094(+)